jgi:uncharacterized membrane protein
MISSLQQITLASYVDLSYKDIINIANKFLLNNFPDFRLVRYYDSASNATSNSKMCIIEKTQSNNHKVRRKYEGLVAI